MSPRIHRLLPFRQGLQLPPLLLLCPTGGLRRSCCPSKRRCQHQQQNRRTHYQYSGPGSFHDENDLSSPSSAAAAAAESPWKHRDFTQRGFTVGIGGPVGSGKTALVLALCRQLYHHDHDENDDKNDNDDHHRHHDNLPLAVVTNDIFTQEDAEFLVKHRALPRDRIVAVETGGCPHAAIREDISSNLSALEELTRRVLLQQREKEEKEVPVPPLLLCESGGDNLAANFSRELADLTLYVIDVAGGDKVPRKGGPGITQSDLLVVNKIDLADAVGADLGTMESDANIMRRYRSRRGGEQQQVTAAVTAGPTIFASIKQGIGVHDICDFILRNYRKATS